MISVVAALFEINNKILLFQRPQNKTRGLQWEFPGGKIEAGENAAQALIRECREELNISISVTEECTRVIHEYPDITIELILLRCQIDSGIITLREHIAMMAVAPEDAVNLNLAPADRRLLKMINS